MDAFKQKMSLSPSIPFTTKLLASSTASLSFAPGFLCRVATCH